MHRLSLSHAFGMTRDEMVAAAREREEREVSERLAREIGAREDERVRALVAAGREHLDAGRFDEARDALSSALLFVPDDAEVRALHERAEREGLLAAARGRLAEGDTVEALIAYQRALEKDPSDEAARREMETVAQQRAAARDASAAGHRRESLGLEALAAGRFAEAESIFTALVADEPGSADAQRFLDLASAAREKEVSLLVSQGNLLDERGLHSSAIAKWRAALALAPGDKDLKKKLSEAEREKSERETSGDAARAQETSVARRAPLSPAELQEIKALYEKGAAVSKAGRTAEAIEYWEIVWRRDPNYGDVKSHLTKGYVIQGMEHYTAGRLSQAIEVWKRALDVDPTDAKALQFVERAGAELAKTREFTKR
jgi:tetratricopeptide (TPR) repeat protein